MSRGKTQTKSRRREERLSFIASLRARKKQRKLRAEIHAAMDKATRMTQARPFAAGPFRAPDVKTERGWEIHNGDGPVAYAGSRDKARAQAKEANEGKRQFQQSGMTREEAMAKLGFERIGDSGPVEDRFRKVR